MNRYHRLLRGLQKEDYGWVFITQEAETLEIHEHVYQTHEEAREAFKKFKNNVKKLPKPKVKWPDITLLKSNTILDYVVERIVEGHSQTNIIKTLQESLSLSYHTSNDYYQRALEEIRKRGAINIEQLISSHLSLYEEIYREGVKMDSFTVVMEAMNRKEKLLKLNEDVVNIQINNMFREDSTTQSLTREQEKRLHLLMSKVLIKNVPQPSF